MADFHALTPVIDLMPYGITNFIIDQYPHPFVSQRVNNTGFWLMTCQKTEAKCLNTSFKNMPNIIYVCPLPRVNAPRLLSRPKNGPLCTPCFYVLQPEPWPLSWRRVWWCDTFKIQIYGAHNVGKDPIRKKQILPTYS